ncbi:MAG: CBS domain-containing protein, partial [Roseitalea porphyridii]|uniref:CBS domain-containing protein n=1 Tax=Roseitalea porphyridii TaxID=1852022 RepID=UPI0032F078BD
AVSSQSIGRGEQMIIEAAARLPRIRVGQIMIHREDLVYLSLSADDEDNLVRARRSMHSRLLLCHNDLEDVVGYVNVKALLWRLVQEPEDREEEGLKRLLGESVREPLRVDPSLEVSVLLQQFSTQHEHLALVEADGRVVGMVTLEDVIEELIGEIDDEYDKSPRLMERLSPGLWRFGGGTLWTDVAAALKLPAEEYLPQDIDLDGRYDVNDLAGDRLRGKLRTGGIFTIEKWRFKVTRMRRGKVLHVEVRLLGQPIGTPN